MPPAPGHDALVARRRAFTLIEVLIAIVVLAVGILGVISLIPTSVRTAASTTDQLVMADLARSVLDALRFAYSEKGSRSLDRRPHQHGVCPGGLFGEYAANVLVACDRRSNVVTGIASIAASAHITSAELEDVLAGRVRRRPIVTARQGRFGAGALFARRRGGRFFDARGRARHASGRAHIRTARAYGQRLLDWMRRFHGVATRYLANYLLWHRVVDRRWRHSTRRGQPFAEGDEALPSRSSVVQPTARAIENLRSA